MTRKPGHIKSLIQEQEGQIRRHQRRIQWLSERGQRYSAEVMSRKAKIVRHQDTIKELEKELRQA